MKIKVIICLILLNLPSVFIDKPLQATTQSEGNPQKNMKTIHLDLDTVIDLILKMNLDIRQSEIDLELSRINLDSARREFHPNLSLSGSANSQWSDNSGGGSDLPEMTSSSNGGSWGDPSESVSMRLSSSYTLFDGFSNRATVKSETANLEATELDGSRTLENVLFQVTSTFLDSLAAKARIDVRTKNLEAQRELLRKIEAFHHAGKRPLADLRQQQAEVASAEYTLITVNRDYDLLLLDLAEGIGLSPGVHLNVGMNKPSSIDRRIQIPSDPKVAVETALKNRSDYRSRKAELEAADASVRAAEGGYWPAISLNMDAGTSYQSQSSSSFGDQFASDNPYASIGLSLNLPIYDRKRTRNAVAQAELRTRQIDLLIKDLKNQISREIHTAYFEYLAAAKQMESAEARIAYTSEALENYEQRYNVNAATLVEVIQARAQHVEAAYEKIAAEYNLMKKQLAIAFYQGQITALMMPGKSVENLSETR